MMPRTNAVAIKSGEIETIACEPQDSGPSLMTPARRAGLDALEREFSEFLRGRQPSEAA